MQTSDILIIGAGMAGAAAAHHLAPHARVTLLERESQPGYHATGRSAAMYAESYGNAVVRALTTASKDFYYHPPPGFAEHALLTPRGALIVGDEAHRAALQRVWSELRALVPDMAWWEQDAILRRVPVLRPEFAACGVYEPRAMDMDVHAIHHGFLRAARAAGAHLVCDAGVARVTHTHGMWQVHSAAGVYGAPIIINAAGAWCDELARMAGVAPLGLVPKRRTAFTFDPPAGADIAGWPLVIDADEQFYFKPDAGQLLASPANEDPVPPQDVQPEELDVAIAVDRVARATTLQIQRVKHQWAGLRTFAADKTPVVGFDRGAPEFFWLAGQGGYGIQTAPALGALTAALILGHPIPGTLATLGFSADELSPERLRAPA